jgi:hypothetical protein
MQSDNIRRSTAKMMLSVEGISHVEIKKEKKASTGAHVRSPPELRSYECPIPMHT